MMLCIMHAPDPPPWAGAFRTHPRVGRVDTTLGGNLRKKISYGYVFDKKTLQASCRTLVSKSFKNDVSLTCDLPGSTSDRVVSEA